MPQNWIYGNEKMFQESVGPMSLGMVSIPLFQNQGLIPEKEGVEDADGSMSLGIVNILVLISGSTADTIL